MGCRSLCWIGLLRSVRQYRASQLIRLRRFLAAARARRSEVAWTCPTCGHFCATQPSVVVAGIQPAGMVLHHGGNAGNPPVLYPSSNAAAAAAYQGGYVDWNFGGGAGGGVPVGNYWPFTR